LLIQRRQSQPVPQGQFEIGGIVPADAVLNSQPVNIAKNMVKDLTIYRDVERSKVLKEATCLVSRDRATR
jgi:hypothetical protein